MAHPLSVPGYASSLERLAQDLGNMRYDKLEEFLEALRTDIGRQAASDESRGRIMLAEALREAALHLEEAKEYIGQAWKISEPYMRD